MSVIFKADGLEAGFTFLIAGSAACAVRPRALPAIIAKEDLRTLRRVYLALPSSDMNMDSPPNFRNPSYFRAGLGRVGWTREIGCGRIQDRKSMQIMESPMSKSNGSRRSLIKGLAATSLAPALLRYAASAQSQEKPWWLGDGMPQEGADTPKIACAINLSDGVKEAAIRGVVQLGVYHVLSGGPALPWTASELRSLVDKLKAKGVTLGNLMIGGFPNTIYGRPGRDEEIEKVRQSIQAAGLAGIAAAEG